MGLARMANLMRSEEFHARTMIPEPFPHSGKIFQMTQRALDCAVGITDGDDDRR